MLVEIEGMFFLCFSYICPCFYSKRDTSEDPVLPRDMNKFNSDSVNNGSKSSRGSSPHNASKSNNGSNSRNASKSNNGSSSCNGSKSASNSYKGSNSSNGSKSSNCSKSSNGSNSYKGSSSHNRSHSGFSSHNGSSSGRVPLSTFRFSRLAELSQSGPLNLSLGQITKLTNNFSSNLKIGEGHFGTVYRAELADGRPAAIKRAKKQYLPNLTAEFKNEVALLTKIEHKNLVQLLGYIEEQNERIIISEYVPNGTLREHLDGNRGKILDFGQRLEIAIDVAHGLTYLHLYAERPIIHRDVKSSNILLTESLHAKVADFGFARAASTDPDQSQVETDIRGTAGYLDPEYLKSNQLTVKSDVFSFGILLLEVLSGRRPVEKSYSERITIRWAFDKYKKRQVKEIIDPMLREEIEEVVLDKYLTLAFRCAAPTRADRPLIKEVVEQLWKIRKEYARNRRQV
ncbi:hypothetical protein LUZ60_017510 [Juncus effusus]|nr:hypothetical protein LUZ60_017510 [Juncus effusus]